MAGLQGKVFGGYRLAEQLAGGGIAEVYRAQPVTPGGREVVVKIIYPEFARHPDFQSNFRNIVQMASKLTNHPHILPVIASGEEAGYLYLVTPYVAQGTLRDWLQAGNRLGPSDVGPFFHQLCGAIAYAHSLGIVHSNLKLSNIFLFEGRHVLVADFGLLWDITHVDMNHSGTGADAVEFLAPEGFSGDLTQQSDIYALGALLFATLTGFPPFQGRKPADLYSAHTQHPVPKLAQAAPQVSPALQGLDSVIQRAMAKRPEERFPSAMALAQAIEGALRQPMPAMQPQMNRGPQGFAAPAQPVHYPAAQPALPAPAQPFMGAPQPPAPPVAPGGGFTPLGQLNPPFQPLGGEQRVDSGMEHGREYPTLAHAAIPRQQRPGPAQPSNDSEIGRTAVVPKPKIPGNPSRAPMPTAAPPQAGWPSQFEPQADEMGPLRIPAIRPQSFAGGANNGAAQANGFAGFQDDSPLGDDRYDDGALHNANAGHEENQGNWWDDPQIMQNPQQGLVPWQGDDYQFGDASMAHSGAFSRPAFSATALELPRLTNPALEGELPPEWEDLLADEFAAQRRANGHGRNGARAAEYANGGPRSNLYPGESYDSGSRYNDWAGEAEQGNWSSSMDYGQWPSQNAGAGASQLPMYDEPVQGPGRPALPQWEVPQGRGASGYAGDSFYDQPVWTVGNTAVRRPSHWLRWTLIALVVLTIAAGTLLIAKPGLCPIAACAQVNQFVRSHLPSVSAPTQQDLLFTPTALDLKPIVGGTSNGTIEMANPGSAALAWKASTDVIWLTVAPTEGTLNARASVVLTITAKPVGVNPDTYHSTVIITIGDHATSVPTTIVVAPGPQLTFSPTKLTFTTCDAPQQATIKNTGGGPLSFTATPSITSALKVTPGKGALDPGKSASVSVSMTCSAQTGAYKVILVSNGGSANLAVQYG